MNRKESESVFLLILLIIQKGDKMVCKKVMHRVPETNEALAKAAALRIHRKRKVVRNMVEIP